MTEALLSKIVYRFGCNVVDGSRAMSQLLGGKGANLAEMTSLGVPVPPGFTITTDVCRHYFEHGDLPSGLMSEVQDSMRWLGDATGHTFGDAHDPLLVSVRSGAPISMPGMMDTILNVGLNDESVVGLAAQSNSLPFALDSYQRLLNMFGTVVLNLPKKRFSELHNDVLPLSHSDKSSSHEQRLQQLIQQYQNLYVDSTGSRFPQDPSKQLELAIRAVFESWRSDRAQFYRKMNGISDELGTAVTIQAMVFGNRGENSGTGVGFTRNPSTGANELFAEFLNNAQGEDIVAGIRTPFSISELEVLMPDVYRELVCVASRIERHYRDVQDFEFTIENGKLYFLQTRTAKRTAQAAVRIAVEMCNEGLITRQEALERVHASNLAELLSPQLDLTNGNAELLTQGLPASNGAAVGKIALSSTMAIQLSKQGHPAILVTEETTADDIQGMAAADGFLTARGGATSHAAVVARGMGKCCITGASAIEIFDDTRTVHIGNTTLREGDWLSLDGVSGRVYLGAVPKKEKAPNTPELDTLLAWAIEERLCEVRANADTPADAANARQAGAVGIGLCRTEHMFFDEDRLTHMRTMILASTREDRVRALNVLLPMQQADFENLFRVMSPLPVTIRLLDPPLHEFLPAPEEIDAEVADARRDEDWDRCTQLEAIIHRIKSLVETNPMMGHRGCRLSLTYPEILEMQVRAILNAATTVRAQGFETIPEIMVPLVASEQEMERLAQMIRKTADDVELELGVSIPYRIGTMIELPRAAVCAGPISKHVQFISFGTNDLTQMTFGFSRDDSSRYLNSYLEQGILKSDPFIRIDEEGVGSLIESAIRNARAVNPSIKVGVCGEHGGDPDSIKFFHKLGVDYVSCSPARISIAQLAAAQC